MPKDGSFTIVSNKEKQQEAWASIYLDWTMQLCFKDSTSCIVNCKFAQRDPQSQDSSCAEQSKPSERTKCLQKHHEKTKKTNSCSFYNATDMKRVRGDNSGETEIRSLIREAELQSVSSADTCQLEATQSAVGYLSPTAQSRLSVSMLCQGP